VLWPRGQRSKALARDLVAAGARVMAPLAYRSVALRQQHALPQAEAVLLASPSCVELWTAMRPAGDAPWALALGPSSATAAGAHAGAFRSPILMLPDPTPDALGALLQNLQP
jgi:uroporphyrinogen-III synthase